MVSMLEPLKTFRLKIPPLSTRLETVRLAAVEALAPPGATVAPAFTVKAPRVPEPVSVPPEAVTLPAVPETESVPPVWVMVAPVRLLPLPITRPPLLRASVPLKVLLPEARVRVPAPLWLMAPLPVSKPGVDEVEEARFSEPLTASAPEESEPALVTVRTAPALTVFCPLAVSAPVRTVTPLESI